VVDHSVRRSMKNAASCVKRCELQDTPSIGFLNAYCSIGFFPVLRLSEGRITKTCYKPVRVSPVASSSGVKEARFGALTRVDNRRIDTTVDSLPLEVPIACKPATQSVDLRSDEITRLI
jgi:hypothetical protein